MENATPGRRVALVVEYDGTRYAGFQLQANARTVQRELEEAMERLTLMQTRVQGAGRTDTGVHAQGQVAAFSTSSQLDCDRFVDGVNHFLPDDVAVKTAYDVPATFDPRRHAKSRVYRYSILNHKRPSPLWERYAYRVPVRLDHEAMGVALRCVEGEHDFAALSGPVGPGNSTVRRVYATRLWREDALVRFEVEANAFLPHQMRRTAGLLVAIGSGNLSSGVVSTALEGRIDPWHMGNVSTSPPRGLCLMQVKYEDFPPNGHKT